MPTDLVKTEDGGEDRVVRTSCDRCHCGCGVLAYVKNRRVIKLEGDPDHPQNEGMLCPKGLATLQLLYHPDRIKHPVKRVGERGEGKWARISWDEALDTCAMKFKEIMSKWGPEAITWSWGDAAGRSSWVTKQLWLYAMKSPTHFHSDAHYCYRPVTVANKVTFGEHLTSENGPDFRNSRCIIEWGGNCVVSHPIQARDMMIARKNGARLIVIDPRFTEMASKADIFLQLRPATDDALALGMLNVIINEGLYDKEFVDKWCLGFEELKQRVQEYPVERVASITWLPSDDIIKAARTYALNRPATIHTRMGVCMSTNAHQGIRAISILVAITGNLDVKGGHVIESFPQGFKSHYDITGTELQLPDEIVDRQIGAKEYPLYASSKALATPCAHGPSVIHAILTGKPYHVKAVWALNDLLLCLEGAEETRKALQNLEFLVGSDFFKTPTMEMCDIIMPPCTFLERDEIEHQFYRNFIAVRQKAIEPLYDTRADRYMDFEIIKRMGLEHDQPWQNIEELNDYMLQGMDIKFDDLKREVAISAKETEYKKYERNGFKTPSGKVELYSSLSEKYGGDPLPFYAENPETPVSSPELAREFPLILITGGRLIVYFHSSNRQLPWLREIAPEPLVEIHPETAANLGIKQGDWVWIEGPYNRGRVKMRTDVSEVVDPRVVHAFSHWWYPERKSDPSHGAFDSNINVILTNDPPYDPVTGATPLRGNLCKIYKVEEG